VMKARLIVLGVCAIVSISIEAFAQKVTVDYDKSVTFVLFKTYAWEKGRSVTSPLLDEQITRSIEKELDLKGLLKVSPESKPDLLVGYNTAFDSEVRFNTINYGWNWGSALADKIPLGTLVVNLGTASNKRLVWTGKATATVDDDPQKAERKINDAVEKMFRKYPLPITR
jgi:hypothetical protein